MAGRGKLGMKSPHYKAPKCIITSSCTCGCFGRLFSCFTILWGYKNVSILTTDLPKKQIKLLFWWKLFTSFSFPGHILLYTCSSHRLPPKRDMHVCCSSLQLYVQTHRIQCSVCHFLYKFPFWFVFRYHKTLNTRTICHISTQQDKDLYNRFLLRSEHYEYNVCSQHH